MSPSQDGGQQLPRKQYSNQDARSANCISSGRPISRPLPRTALKNSRPLSKPLTKLLVLLSTKLKAQNYQIFRYPRRMASPSRHSEFDAMYKIVLVGDAGVGKTNILGEDAFTPIQQP